MPPAPSNSDDLKRYYSIGEVAERLGVKTSQVRFWESSFDHIKATKNSRGDRRFTRRNIGQLEQVHHLVKERGFTLEGAKREIERLKQAPEEGERAAILAGLREARARLLKLRDGE